MPSMSLTAISLSEPAWAMVCISNDTASKAIVFMPPRMPHKVSGCQCCLRCETVFHDSVTFVFLRFVLLKLVKFVSSFPLFLRCFVVQFPIFLSLIFLSPMSVSVGPLGLGVRG